MNARTGIWRQAMLAAAAAAAASSLAGAQETARSALSVAVETVEHLDRAVVEETFAGLVAARRTSALGFDSGGRIASVNVDVGDRVTAGDELAALDRRTLDAEVEAAEATLAEARANLVLARLTEGRQNGLIDRGHVSQQSVDEAHASVDAALARVVASEARLELLNAREDLAVLTAPFDGVVTRRVLDEGAVAAPGAMVLELVETDVLEMHVGVPLRRARALEPGTEYRLVVGDREVAAVFRASTNVVDRATQTVAAVFDIPDPAELSAGEVARVALPVEIDAEGFWAPLTALSEGRRGLWTVYALAPSDGEEGVYRAEPRVVEVLHTEADRAYVRGSADNGDRIVASGLDRIVPGQRVIPSDGERAIARAQD